MSLSERFIIPPMATFDARQGYWADRKRHWINIGIKSEEGRGEESGAFSMRHIGAAYGRKEAPESRSIFDPVLTELFYRWFVPEREVVLDPFAGGSVRGIVAGKLSRGYAGIELRREQVVANYEQLNKIPVFIKPKWYVGDSHQILDHLPTGYGGVFTCPPYAYLEKYSDDPADLSNMEYPQFLKRYREIITKSITRLNPNRFAGIVVGDVRDKREGHYLNFVGDTITAFLDAGVKLYINGILIVQANTIGIRAAKPFLASRKLMTSHQHVLIFIKGDAKTATKAIGDVEVEGVNEGNMGSFMEGVAPPELEDDDDDEVVLTPIESIKPTDGGINNTYNSIKTTLEVVNPLASQPLLDTVTGRSSKPVLTVESREEAKPIHFIADSDEYNPIIIKRSPLGDGDKILDSLHKFLGGCDPRTSLYSFMDISHWFTRDKIVGDDDAASTLVYRLLEEGVLKYSSGGTMLLVNMEWV